MKKVVIETVEGYIKECTNIQNNLETYIYRGQSNEAWPLVSGVYRRIESSKRNAKLAKCNVLYDEVMEYLNEKLVEARKRITSQQLSEIQEINDISILVEMQHYGGATNLIDFSYNSLIALYFACADHTDTNGQIFCINNNNPYKVLSTNKKTIRELFPTPEGKFYSHSPNHSNRRIIKQDSIFIFNDLGYIEEALVDYIFIVKAEGKEKIIKDLRDFAGITEESIYPDFLGYLQANNSRKPFRIKTAQDYYDLAVKLHKEEKYQQAIDYYEKSLSADSNQSRAYLGIAQCYRNQERFTEAIDKCKKAHNLDNKNFMISNEMAILYTYSHDYTGARTAFEHIKTLINTEGERKTYLNNLGWMYLCFAEYEQAEAILSNLINDDKPYHQAVNLGHCCLLNNKEDEALKYYTISFKNATSENNFWKGFDLDYKAIQMDRFGITPEYFSEIKRKIMAA